MRSLVMLIGVAGTVTGLLGPVLIEASKAQTGDRTTSLAAFKEMSIVLRHPRCQNCHTRTEYPRQGNDRHRHGLNVRRGPEGRGVAGQRCAACHGRANNAASGVPGADEDWHLAPLSMGWEGRSDAELCSGLKDPTKNGGRSNAQIIDHLDTPLVRWAWAAGSNINGMARQAPPLSYGDFRAAAERWIATGATCPD